MPQRPGQIVKYHTPMPDEDPEQLYVVLEILNGDRTDAKIKALNTGRPLAPVFVTDINDLMVVELSTGELTGHAVHILKPDGTIEQGIVTGTLKEKTDPTMKITQQGVLTDIELTITTENGMTHTGLLLVIRS